eukprot:1807669-Heterocapsa_arctica.AAC.1
MTSSSALSPPRSTCKPCRSTFCKPAPEINREVKLARLPKSSTPASLPTHPCRVPPKGTEQAKRGTEAPGGGP